MTAPQRAQAWGCTLNRDDDADRRRVARLAMDLHRLPHQLLRARQRLADLEARAVELGMHDLVKS